MPTAKASRKKRPPPITLPGAPAAATSPSSRSITSSSRSAKSGMKRSARLRASGCSSRFPYFVQAHGVHFIHIAPPAFANQRLALPARSARLCFRWRWRCLLHRRQPFQSRRAQECEAHLRGHGQPRLRPHQKADLAHLPYRFQIQDRCLGYSMDQCSTSIPAQQAIAAGATFVAHASVLQYPASPQDDGGGHGP